MSTPQAGGDRDEQAVCAIVLAGERPGGSALARALDLPAAVLAEVGGHSSLARVMRALEASGSVSGGWLVGPASPVDATHPAIAAVLASGRFRWCAPAAGPSACALRYSSRLIVT